MKYYGLRYFINYRCFLRIMVVWFFLWSKAVLALETDVGATAPGPIEINPFKANNGDLDPGFPGEPPTFPGEPALTPPVGILLERDDDYWVPRYNNTTQVTAKLYELDNDGKTWIPSLQKRIIHIQFSARSNEPGVALNYDLPSGPQASPDIYFPADQNLAATCSDAPASTRYLYGACKTNLAVSAHTFTVQSRDYGSFSTLVARCEQCVVLRESSPKAVINAAPLLSTAEDGSGLKLPKDDNNNQIADAWLWDWIVKPKATDDLDYFPLGNGVVGDGLSAYEEYRGLFVSGKHQRTSLRSKDMFIYNRDNLPLTMFNASGLRLHEVFQLELEERVINFNSGHAHVVEQHGVKLTNTVLEAGIAGSTDSSFLDLMLGNLGPPKHVTVVNVDVTKTVLRLSTGKIIRDNTGQTVAHELGHAVMVQHHGEGSKFYNYRVESDPSLTKPSVPGSWSFFSTVKVPGNRLCGTALPTTLDFGAHKHNTHSGDTSCFMRYRYVASVYEQEDGSLQCRSVPEPPKTGFCTAKSGGYNVNNGVAGDAELGDCLHQIQVNDK